MMQEIERMLEPVNKQAILIQLISRPSGATLAEISQATGWQPHTIRSTISATLKKKLGLNIVTGRLNAGATVYRLIGSLPVTQTASLPIFAHARSERTEIAIKLSSQNQKSSDYTVTQMIQDYMSHYSKEGKGILNTTKMVNAHILPSLGNFPIDQLTTKIVSDWHYGLSQTPIRNRKQLNEKNAEADNPDFVRRRRSSANRILTILKAALNYAWRLGKIDSDLAWKRVQAFRGVDAPVIRYLNEEDCKRLVTGCDPDLRLIVQAGLLTGCRYGEIGRLVASDYRADTGTIYVKISKSGKPRHIVLTDEGKQFFEKIVRNKAPSEHMFRTRNGQLWGKSLQTKRMLAACKRANINPPVSYHILRHTYGSLLAMKGAPMTVVAKQLGHANTQITEKHYAHISAGYVAQVVRESFPSLKIT